MVIGALASPRQGSFFRTRRQDSMSAASRITPIFWNGGPDGGYGGGVDGGKWRILSAGTQNLLNVFVFNFVGFEQPHHHRS